jgi:hypothetical protein
VKRLSVLLLLLFVACGRETKDEDARTMTLPANPPPPPAAAKHQPRTGGIIPKPNSTPSRCAGRGTYEDALDCFRMTSGFHFTLDGANGEMTRPTPGMESVRFAEKGGSTWLGEAKKAGVVWSRNGKHELSPPDLTYRVWQRTTMVLDPQKKEGTPQLAGVESVNGEPCNHYHFTNANSGEVNDVWVSTKDGRIVKWKAGSSTLEMR